MFSSREKNIYYCSSNEGQYKAEKGALGKFVKEEKAAKYLF